MTETEKSRRGSSAAGFFGTKKAVYYLIRRLFYGIIILHNPASVNTFPKKILKFSKNVLR